MATETTMLLLIHVLFLLLASVGSSQPTGSYHQSENKIRWIDCRDQVPFTLDPTGVDLNNLPSTLHCGEIVVPMDYAKLISAHNNITIGLSMYRPEKKPKGVVFFNPGGTDEATVFAWQAALDQTEEFSGLTDFDLMMMDVRGTYHSNALNVSLDGFSGLVKPYPTTKAEFKSFRDASAMVFQSWADLSSPPGILQYLGTKEVVQDFESIRKALCYDKINFLGASYGSFRAAQYAATYPSRVGNFVLDAVALLGFSPLDQAQDQIAAANRGLLRADAYCQNNNSCPFKSAGKGSVPDAFHKVLAAAANVPLIASQCINSTSCTSPVTASNIQQGLLDALFGQPDFPVIIEALELALRGDASLFAIAAADPIPNVESVWSMPLLCNDYNLGKNNFEAFRDSFDAESKKDVGNIGKAQGWQILLWCSAWKYPVPASKPLSIKAPMLLVTADFDNSTPTEWARLIWELSPKSGLVIRHGDDHVSIQLPIQPSSLITKEFIRSGKLPAARKETSVSVYTPGMQLRPIADPYSVPTGARAGDVDSS